MKVVLSIVLALILSATACSQHFEGKIVYQNAYKSKLPNVSDARFTELMGSTQKYFIKGGNYKSVSNGNSFNWHLYINKENKLYRSRA